MKHKDVLVLLALLGLTSPALSQDSLRYRPTSTPLVQPAGIRFLTTLDDASQEKSNGAQNGKKEDKPPKTLFQWSFGPEQPDDEDEEEDDTIVTDRPDFTEASSTVGRGRFQIETGYTFTRNKSGGFVTRNHSYPETLIRIGMFAEWFELRIGQNFTSEAIHGHALSSSSSGADDLYLGVKLGLTEQKGFLPEMAIILQSFVPTSGNDDTAKELLPGFNLLYGWDVVKDALTLGGSFGINREHDELGHYFYETHKSLTIGYILTEKLGAYTEWFGIFPSSALAPDVGPQYYFNGGFTYRPVKYMQFDIRAGVGLNKHADDFFIGPGFSIKF